MVTSRNDAAKAGQVKTVFLFRNEQEQEGADFAQGAYIEVRDQAKT